MRLALLLFAPFYAGCAGEAYPTCDAIPVFSSVYSEVPIDCQSFARNTERALDMLVVNGVVPYSSIHDFNRVNVVVSDSRTLNGVSEIGMYQPETEKIYLARDGSSLLHEMLHHWDWIHMVINTSSHPGWCEKGWGPDGYCAGSETLDHVFRSIAEPISYGTP